MPSYTVKAARRVITDIIRDRSRQRNIISDDTPEMLGRLNPNRKARLKRGTTPQDRETARKRASEARWEGHESKSSLEARAKHAEREMRRRARRRIEEQGDISVPRHLEKRTRTRKTHEERMRQQKEYRVAKVGAMTPEEREASKVYQRQKTAEYRARQRAAKEQT